MLLSTVYRIAGNFRGVQFSRMASLQSFRGLIFADARHHAHYTLYNRTYFAGLIFADSRLSAKTAKIGPLENFPLYGNILTHFFGRHRVDILWDTWCGWVGGCAGIHTGLSIAGTSGGGNQTYCSTIVLVS